MDLSIIIVSHDSEPFLDGCLASVARYVTGVSVEVCVVDNASHDASRRLVANRSDARLIANAENRGFAAAVNQGLEKTVGHFVLWLNPDAVLLDDGVPALLEYLDRHPEVGVIGPRILDPDGSLQRSVRAFPSYDWALGHRHSLLTRFFPGNPYSRRYLLGDFDPSLPRDVDWVSGACLLHRRAVVDRIGGLDESFFMYCEDIDFCLRARRANWVVQYHPALSVMHRVGGSTELQSRAMLVARHRSLWRYYRKHFDRQFLIDAVAWSAIWARCALVVSQEFARSALRARS